MSSLTSQESSNTQPQNPVNPGEDSTGTFKGDGSVPFKTGGASDPAGLSTSVDKVSHTDHVTIHPHSLFFVFRISLKAKIMY